MNIRNFRRPRDLLLAICLLTIPGTMTPVLSQTVSDSLLSSYVRESWSNHPDLRAMRAMVVAESSRTVMSRAWMNPELRGGLMNTPTDFDLHKDPMTMFQIGVMQKIPFPGKLGSASQAGRARTEAAKADVNDAEFKMAEMVVMAYYDLAAALQIRHALERGQDLSEQIVKAAAASLSTGMGTQADVLRAQLESEQWSQRLVSNQADINRKRATLAYAIGRSDISTLVDPSLPDSSPAVPEITSALSDESLNNTPEIRRAQLRSRAADADLRRSRLGIYPDLGLGFAYGIRQDLRTTGTDPHTGAPVEQVMPQDNMVTIELTVPFPLFYRDNQRAQTSEYLAMKRNAEQETEREKLAKRQELLELHAQIEEKVENSRIAVTSVVPRADETWRAALQDYRAAKLPFMSLSEARMNVIMAQMDAIMLRADAWSAYYRWKAALGQPLFENLEP